MAEKAKMEVKKQVNMKAFQSDERAWPHIDWGDNMPDEYIFGK